MIDTIKLIYIIYDLFLLIFSNGHSFVDVILYYNIIARQWNDQMILLSMIKFFPKNDHFLTNESNRALYGAPVHFYVHGSRYGMRNKITR